MGVLRSALFPSFVALAVFSNLGSSAPPTLKKVAMVKTPYGARLDLGVAGIERLGSVVERDHAWVYAEPCRLAKGFPREHKLAEAELSFEIQSVEGEKGQLLAKCKLIAKSRRTISALKTYKFSDHVEVHLFPDESAYHLFQDDREVHRLLDEGTDQDGLRQTIARMASRRTAYGDDLLHNYFRTGTFPLVAGSAYGVCRAQRFSFLQQIEDVHLDALFSGTPDDAWLSCCLERFAFLRDLQTNPEMPAEMVKKAPEEIEKWVLAEGEAGDLVSSWLWKRLSGTKRESLDARRLNFWLALAAESRKNWAGMTAALERTAYGDEPFSWEMPVDASWDCAEASRKVLRVNRTNVQFWRGQILRDQLKQYREAAAVFHDLAKNSRKEVYHSLEEGARGFSQPAVAAARKEEAQTLMQAGRKRKACEAWVDLAWREAKSIVTASEEQMSFCEVSLQKLGEECKEFGGLLLKNRRKEFRKTPEICRARYKEVMAALDGKKMK